MPLPASGNPISLYQMQDYATDANLDNDADISNPVSINDAVIRDIIGKSAGTTMSFSEWYGASGIPAKNVSITVGVITYQYATWSGQQATLTPSFGSATVTSLNNIYLPINWRGLFHIGNSSGDGLFLRLNQGSNSDLVMSKIVVTVGGSSYVYFRSDATYSNLGNSNHSWKWTQASTIFGANNSTATVKWYIEN
jgi:hypothetical protein